MKPTLVVLAAGMGSRYGGLKQIDPVGPGGEIVMDYSAHDALMAGFGKLVFVIRPDIEASFRETIGRRLEKRADVAYVFQELAQVPEGFQIPETREKPWGTAHAILPARSAVAGNFAAINADDFYGADSFRSLAKFLQSASDGSKADYAMVGFTLRNTLSDHGSVARGVCSADDQGFLERVEELTKIERDGQSARHTESDGSIRQLSGDERVSMNMWGFTPSFFDFAESAFERFLKERGQEEKSEFLIPTVVDELISAGRATCRVLPTDSSWFGVTYQEDRPHVVENLRALVDQGVYPQELYRDV